MFKPKNSSDFHEFDLDLNIKDDDLNDPLLLQELAELTQDKELAELTQDKEKPKQYNKIKLDVADNDIDNVLEVTEADMNDPALLVY
jgi:hypothetical protein